MRRIIATALTLVTTVLIGGSGSPAAAQDQGVVGAPVGPGTDFLRSMDMQTPYGPVKQAIYDFDKLVFWLMVAVVVFVAALLAYAIWRFRARPTRTPPAPATTRCWRSPGRWCPC